MTERSLPTMRLFLSETYGKRTDYKGNVVITTNMFLINVVPGDHHNTR